MAASENEMTHEVLHSAPRVAKSPSGIRGLDQITGGGLPTGRPTLVCGGPGCGKTLLAAEFLARGALEFGEPGVFMAFEETPEDLAQNLGSLGIDLDQLVAERKLAVDYVYIDASEIEETGAYDLDGLFIRLGDAIDTLQAKRVVLDTIEVLFSGLSDTTTLRSEVRRLFRWLKDKGVTVIVTAERGEGSITRNGLEEYVSDCVIMLDHRVNEQISTRRLRIVKYRGSAHGTNEFPFLIDDFGISVIPITSAGMDHPASLERVSTGITGVDQMLGGKGFFRGSSILISGTAGTGKTSAAGSFVVAACERGERCLYFSFEESCGQLVRNLRSIGVDFQRGIDAGLLDVISLRPTRYGLEMHLAQMQKQVEATRPQNVVIDPISNFVAAGTLTETITTLVRLVDFLKERSITSVFTNLAHYQDGVDETDVGISSIIDTWLLLRDVEEGGERHATICVLKSRGMPHSRSVMGFRLTDHGIELKDGGLSTAGRIGSDAMARA